MVKKRLSNIFFFTPDGVRARAVLKISYCATISNGEIVCIEHSTF